jgi:hypothetical protein
MRNDLAYRRPINDTMTQFWIQWVGSHVWFYGTKHAYGRFFVMADLAEHDAEQNPYEASYIHWHYAVWLRSKSSKRQARRFKELRRVFHV